MRGAGIIAAWVGWFDSRFENTRIRLDEQDKTVLVKGYLTDLGGGLGWSGGPLDWRMEDAERFPWRFTRRDKDRFRVVHFRLIEETPAFQEMTIEDACWAAEKISQLTEKQIFNALLASGCATETAQTFTAKLLARRKYLSEDLGMPSAEQKKEALSWKKQGWR